MNCALYCSHGQLLTMIFYQVDSSHFVSNAGGVIINFSMVAYRWLSRYDFFSQTVVNICWLSYYEITNKNDDSWAFFSSMFVKTEHVL